jgi:signal transduction histidine kinase
MKLISKTTILYLLLFLGAFTASGLLISRQFQKLFDKQTERHFHRKEHSTLYRIAHHYKMGEINHLYRQVVDLGTVHRDTNFVAYKDTLLMDDEAKEPQLFLKKTFIRKVDGRYYQISLYKYVEEYRALLHGIFSSLVWVFVGLVVVLVASNLFISGWLWRPFYHTLGQIRNFSFNQSDSLNLKKTSTREFRELNMLYSQLITKVETDYHNLKEYTENTAHEIQTPLAIIKAKIESILRRENLDESLLLPLSSINRSASKLSRLSRTLNLLTKIENQEFVAREEIAMATFLKEMIFGFEDLAQLKDIEIKSQLDEKQKLMIDPFLLDILLGNLMKNAIRYNHPEGQICIETFENELILRNTGAPLQFESEKIFQRFYHNGNSSESLGLGLAIVKKICDLNGFSILYEYREGMHCMRLKF